MEGWAEAHVLVSRDVVGQSMVYEPFSYPLILRPGKVSHMKNTMTPSHLRAKPYADECQCETSLGQEKHSIPFGQCRGRLLKSILSIFVNKLSQHA